MRERFKHGNQGMIQSSLRPITAQGSPSTSSSFSSWKRLAWLNARKIENRFNDLRTSPRGGAEYILSIESGPQISPEGLHRSF